MKRTLDATFINEVLNIPEVHKWMGVEGPIDVSDAVSNPYNYCLVNDLGGFVVVQLTEGVYEVHSAFKPEAGHNAATFMQECMEYMFLHTNCIELRTQLPDDNVPARKLAERGGFHVIFRREKAVRGPTAYASLHIDRWVHDCAFLEASGELFHDQLQKAKLALGGELDQHPHDTAHERAVGAVVRMIQANNAPKAVDFYNRWAKFAGYAPITLLNETPIIVDVIDAIVEWNGREIEVLECR